MRASRCPYFGLCGGCSYQDVDYTEQLARKERIVKEKLGVDELSVFSGDEYGYRNRMDMVFTSKGIGFRKRGTWDKVFDVEKCPISNKRLNDIITEVRGTFNDNDWFDPKKQQGTLRYAVIRTPSKTDSVSFVLNSDSKRVGDAIDRIKKFAETTSVKNVLVTYVPKKTDVSVSEDYFVVRGADTLDETYLGHEFEYSTQGFFQNNHKVAEMLHTYCRGLLKSYGGSSHLLDLYGGVGTFGIINADLFEQVKVVENHAGSIDSAKKNIVKNAVQNVEAIVQDAKNIRNIGIGPNPTIITDPPRSGMSPKTINRIKELEPNSLTYVSCNINQLAKDLDKFGMGIKSVALFDMFPQTPHIETVVELTA